jgi:hypothetical protein
MNIHTISLRNAKKKTSPKFISSTSAVFDTQSKKNTEINLNPSSPRRAKSVGPHHKMSHKILPNINQWIAFAFACRNNFPHTNLSTHFLTISFFIIFPTAKTEKKTLRKKNIKIYYRHQHKREKRNKSKWTEIYYISFGEIEQKKGKHKPDASSIDKSWKKHSVFTSYEEVPRKCDAK